MKKYQVQIEGVTPYLQHRMDDTKLDEWERLRGRIIEREDVGHEDNVRAQYHMFLDNNNQPFIPAEHLMGSFINAGSFVKAKVGNANKSMKNIVAGMFAVTPARIPLPVDSWVVDKRSAVNRNVKARVIVVRPKWEQWAASFTLSVDNDTVTDETVRKIIEYAGQYCGIGSFRPTNNGMFGRFKITGFQKAT